MALLNSYQLIFILLTSYDSIFMVVPTGLVTQSSFFRMSIVT